MPDTTEKTLANEKVLPETPDGEEPTPEEKISLRHVAENLPVSAWLVAVVELCERFAYYGMQGLFQNYINLPLDGSEGRGALGMGHQGATGLTTFFQFWCYGILALSLSLSFFSTVTVWGADRDSYSDCGCYCRRSVSRKIQNHCAVLWCVHDWSANSRVHLDSYCSA